mmetsp:Transcript_18027/g.20848  ORF Transcript_18027/g.20848 Transcript_18027/m.20848 type:complete len:180 (-) Transcript_18027:30-569(-)
MYYFFHLSFAIENHRHILLIILLNLPLVFFSSLFVFILYFTYLFLVLKQASLRRDLRNVTVDIEIYTDSSYAWNLLKNSTQLLNWGSHPTIEEFVYDGDYPIGFANRDLLYPLSKTIHGMVRNTIVTRDGTKLCLGNIHISFRHSGEVVYDIVPGDYTRRLNSYAKKAAIWQFKKTQIA